MKRLLHPSILFVLPAVLLSACGGGGGGGGGPSSGGSSAASGPDITEALTVNGTPAFKLSTGDIVLLNKPEDDQWYLDRFPPPPPASKSIRPQVRAFDTLPASVDLTQYQTPVKNQVNRGTCCSFATAAAIEAEYKRSYNLTLDLSEQWVAHIQKMDSLDTWDKSPGLLEDQVGNWGGGSVIYNLELFSSGKLGIPEETAMTYAPWMAFEDTTDWNPSIPFNTSQRTADDLNLSQNTVTYNMTKFDNNGKVTGTIPIAWNILPQVAQNTARYRANQVLYAQSGDLKSPDWFKTQLASGHEVAFGFSLDKDTTVVNGVWMPGKTYLGGHCMLLIGYDDSKQAFRIKNSWGTGWGDNGYIWFSYDWMNQGKVHSAVVVQSVMPPWIAMSTNQLFIGRYNLDHDGWQGLLDIYHVPDSNVFHFKSGDPDNRLGTYYGPDNLARRVNGTINGRKIDFYIDWSNTGARGYGELTGLHYTGYLADDNQTLAGTMLDNRDGQTYGFYGLKPKYLSGQAAGSSASPTSYVGNWQVYGKDIPSGSFGITAVNPITGIVTGNEFGGGALTGTVSIANPRVFNFALQGQNYHGYLFGLETGVMAGTVGSGINTTGFVAFRSDFGKPLVSIITPVSQVYRSVMFQLVGEAKGDNGSGFLVDLPCNWTIDGSPLGSTACSQMYSGFSTNGSHTIQLSATGYGNATATTSITVNVVDPPALPVINSISINGIVLIASPNGTQNFSYDPYQVLGNWGSMPTLNMIGLASGQAEPLQYVWKWHYTDSHNPACPEFQIGTGGAPSWTPAYDNTNCVIYGHGDLTLYVTDANNQTVSQAVHLQFVSPPF